ncbi:MAG TPA: OmpH family outer membrane protein [Blastocatellia bacterium]|nr:OmpH family outer membrane protein [Blastocatellia bacterium]
MRISIAFAISALLSLVSFAQTTPQPPRSAPQNPAASEGGSGAQGKVAIINTAAFRGGIGEFKTTLEALNKEFEPKNNELLSLQKQIEDLKNKVQSPSPTVQPSVRDGWIEQGTELEKTLKRKSEDYQALFQKRGQEMVGPIMDKINKFFDQYCQQRNIVVVLERQIAENSNLLVWVRPDAEITEDFINEYNKTHPSSTPAAPRK